MKQRIVKIDNEHTDEVLLQIIHSCGDKEVVISFWVGDDYYNKVIHRSGFSIKPLEHTVETLPDEIINDLVNKIVGEK